MKKITKNTDSWIVISPGRTGSGVICAALYNIYSKNSPNNLKFHHAGIVNHLPMKYLDLVHTHKIDDLNLALEDTQCVLSTRNMVESALSFCIQPHIGYWHVYKHDNIPSINIKPFVLNIDDFFYHYNNAVQFFKTIGNKLQKNTIVIDYEEFCNDTNNISNILGYGVELNSIKLPIKNPGMHKDWILNWDEIEPIISALPKIPKW
jgi:hypothetical protein